MEMESKRLKSSIQSRESDWTFGDGQFCVQVCIETLCKRANLMAHLTNFFFEFFYKIFTEDASLILLYHGAKKSKMTKNSIQGGSCLKTQFWQESTFSNTSIVSDCWFQIRKDAKTACQNSVCHAEIWSNKIQQKSASGGHGGLWKTVLLAHVEVPNLSIIA